MPEEDVPQLSADRPSGPTGTLEPIASPSGGFGSPPVPPQWTPGRCSLKAEWFFGGGHFLVCDVSGVRSNEFLSKLLWFTEQHCFLLLGFQPAPEFRCRYSFRQSPWPRCYSQQLLRSLSKLRLRQPCSSQCPTPKSAGLRLGAQHRWLAASWRAPVRQCQALAARTPSRKRVRATP
jgi:hypothetical protein